MFDSGAARVHHHVLSFRTVESRASALEALSRLSGPDTRCFLLISANFYSVLGHVGCLLHHDSVVNFAANQLWNREHFSLAM